jgi:hypothetical protein
MKATFQKSLLSLVAKDLYRVDTDMGCVYSYRVKKDSWDRLKGTVVNGGYRQLELFLGAKSWTTLKVYEHVAVWIAGYGLIPPGGEIKHKDGDVTNNKLWNLFLVIKPVKRQSRVRVTGQLTAEQADDIFKLYNSGMTNHCRIAEELLMDRQKVRRCIMKLKSGESFRFESEHGHNSFIGRSLSAAIQLSA